MFANAIRRSTVLWPVALVSMIVAVNSASAQEVYRVTDLGAVGAWTAEDINNSGLVVGQANFGSDVNHAYVFADLDANGVADSDEIIDLGALPGQFNVSNAWAINDAGIIVGESRHSDDVMHAIRWSNELEDLGPSHDDGGHGYGQGINTAGTVVGRLYGVGGAGHRAVRWSSDGWTDLWEWGTGEGSAEDVNNVGQIVGWRFYTSQEGRAAFLVSNGSIVDLGGLGWNPRSSWATAINQHGSVVGWSYTDTGFSHAFLWVPFGPNGMSGRMHDLGTLGGNGSWAYDVNNRGEVVGEAETEFGGPYAFLYSGGRVVNLNSLLPADSEWTLWKATAINDRGQIVGVGHRAGQNPSGFLLTPNDADGDGLLDGWESAGGGIDVNGDGTIDLDLFALGARPDHKDIFVEVDAMVGLRPAPRAVSRVMHAFAAAPVENPDGVNGIQLHVIVDETDIPRVEWNAMEDVDGDGLGDWPTAFDPTKSDRFGSAADRASPNAANILAARRRAFRYCIFASSYDGSLSSGLAELPGNDFIVTMGNWRTPGGSAEQQAGTFMHELGHTLGLRHGGIDHTNFKPNYYSVMNYTWQFPEAGYRQSWRLDYSAAALPTVQENDLDETAGFGGPEHVLVPIGPPPATIVSMGGSVDFNRDGDTDDTSATADLNRVRAGLAASPGQVLVGHADWSSIVYGLAGNGDFAEGAHESAVGLIEADQDVHDDLGAIPGPSPLAGDTNCDAVVNFDDIDPFVVALVGEEPYESAYPACDWLSADIDISGDVDFDDIDGFVECLINGGCT